MGRWRERRDEAEVEVEERRARGRRGTRERGDKCFHRCLLFLLRRGHRTHLCRRRSPCRRRRHRAQGPQRRGELGRVVVCGIKIVAVCLFGRVLFACLDGVSVSIPGPYSSLSVRPQFLETTLSTPVGRLLATTQCDARKRARFRLHWFVEADERSRAQASLLSSSTHRSAPPLSSLYGDRVKGPPAMAREGRKQQALPFLPSEKQKEARRDREREPQRERKKVLGERREFAVDNDLSSSLFPTKGKKTETEKKNATLFCNEKLKKTKSDRLSLKKKKNETLLKPAQAREPPPQASEPRPAPPSERRRRPPSRRPRR